MNANKRLSWIIENRSTMFDKLDGDRYVLKKEYWQGHWFLSVDLSTDSIRISAGPDTSRDKVRDIVSRAEPAWILICELLHEKGL